jgi:hypothetical protein
MNTHAASASDRDWQRPGLSPVQQQIVRAFAEALLAEDSLDPDVSEARSPDPILLDRIAHEMDVWIGSGSQALTRGFGVLLWGIELMPVLIVGRACRMSKLSISERIHYLESLEQSSVGLIATMFMGVKIPVTALAFELGEELADTGFDRSSLTSLRVFPPKNAGVSA